MGATAGVCRRRCPPSLRRRAGACRRIWPTSPRSTRCARWPTRWAPAPTACTSSSTTPASGPAGPHHRQESRDGYELRFAVNHLAGFLLTTRLLGLLCASAPARVVNVASLGQHPIDFDDVMLHRGHDGWRAYGQSKLAQVMAGFELAERLSGTGVAVASLHPGTYMPTKMVLQQVGHTVDSLETGVEATVRLAVAPELEGVTGRFFDRREPARADPQAYDREARRRLWELSLELTGESEPRFGGLS